MRRRLPKRGTWSVTPLGVVLLGVLLAAAIVCAMASKGVQAVAFFVLLADGLMLAGSGLSGGMGFGA